MKTSGKVKATELRQLIKERRATAFTLEGDKWSWDGYPLAVGTEYVLFHALEDFHLDGYCCLKMSHLSCVRPRNGRVQRILKSEGIKDAVGIDLGVDLSGTRQVLRSLRGLGTLIIVDFDFVDDPFCHVGKPVRLNKETFSFMGVNTAGVWWDRPRTRIPYADVSAIRFGCEYADVYTRYARERRRRSA